MHDFFLRAEADASPAGGAEADLSAVLQLCLYPIEYSGLTVFSGLKCTSQI